MSDFRARFWNRMCGFQSELYVLLVFDLVMLTVALLTLPHVAPDSASGVLVRVDILLFGAVLPPLVAILYRCRTGRDGDRG